MTKVDFIQSMVLNFLKELNTEEEFRERIRDAVIIYQLEDGVGWEFCSDSTPEQVAEIASVVRDACIIESQSKSIH